ncbi:MAG TPA: hypothetical protein PLP75_03210, partial [Burkholderiales bacterium]|nr:hypothetical protein [Burkholderiales bacterium]
MKVDEGSGVLFQPMTEQYSYILTAKHNLYNDDNNDQEVFSYTLPKDLLNTGGMPPFAICGLTLL